MGEASSIGARTKLAPIATRRNTFTNRSAALIFSKAMEHGIYEVKSFKLLGPYTLEIQFDDGVTTVVNLDGALEGELYGPLKDPSLFERVKLDKEIGNLVWPNGADFDPEILHDWPERRARFVAAAQEWKISSRQ